jgi:signal transduction histidine kinase
MPHVARLGGDHQSDGEKHEEPNWVSNVSLGDRSAAEQRTYVTEGLAILGEMTGGIAHDFRNMLAIIGSSLRFAEKHSGEPEKVSCSIAAARDGIDRGLKLTSQLLAFAKQRELPTYAGDANEYLKTLESLLKFSAGSSIRIVLALASDVPMCLLDSSQFDAAIINLVVNARDAMPNGGEIQIGTMRCEVKTATPSSPAPGIYARVRVKDTGHGISPETLKRVFDPLFTTKGEQGTGLGLSQVYAFMRLVGGHISVASVRGGGTTFDLWFPSVQSRRIDRDRHEGTGCCSPQ